MSVGKTLEETGCEDSLEELSAAEDRRPIPWVEEANFIIEYVYGSNSEIDDIEALRPNHCEDTKEDTEFMGSLRPKLLKVYSLR